MAKSAYTFVNCCTYVRHRFYLFIPGSHVMYFANIWSTAVRVQYKQANSENLCPPPRFFLRIKESSENVKFIGGVTLTRYILST